MARNSVKNVSINDFTQFAIDALNKKPRIEIEVNQELVNKARKAAFAQARMELSVKLGHQSFRYRGILFYFLLVLMAIETLFLFVIIYFTSDPAPKLIIHDTTLQIIVGATIVQISTMVIVIIQSVFPKDMKQLIDISKEISDLK